MYHIDSAL